MLKNSKKVILHYTGQQIRSKTIKKCLSLSIIKPAINIPLIFQTALRTTLLNRCK